jgi:hypothetical protein
MLDEEYSKQQINCDKSDYEYGCLPDDEIEETQNKDRDLFEDYNRNEALTRFRANADSVEEKTHYEDHKEKRVSP